MERSFLSKILFVTISVLSTVSVLAATEPSTMGTAAQQVETGKKYFNDGQFEDALSAWNAALEEYRQADDKAGQARVLQNKAAAYMNMGHAYQAVSSLQSALKLAKDAGDEPLAVQVAGSLGTAYLLTNRTSEAKTLLENATSETIWAACWHRRATTTRPSRSINRQLPMHKRPGTAAWLSRGRSIRPEHWLRASATRKPKRRCNARPDRRRRFRPRTKRLMY
jgi:tetratricopeptide (TPR) repeat protein